MNYEIKEIQAKYDEFNKDFNTLTPKQLNEKYLGKRGEVKKLLSEISQQKQEDKAVFGKEVNILKTYIEEKISITSDKVSDGIESNQLDVSAPYDINTKFEDRPKIGVSNGTIHPLMKELKYILDIFEKLGFDIEESRQIDDDYHMFESLNIPQGHPARDIWDSFWTDEHLTPPAQTSTMQNRIMKSKSLPIRCVIPGRCFRNEATDASHEHTFYQIEGIYIDKGISLGNMIATIKTYLEAFFETNLDIKVQPGYFPFVEPGCEFMISCPFCRKTGCNICGYKGWMEIMGCGMIHPNVLREGGIDPEVYTGFAWGFGLDRLVMLKNSIKELRRFHSGDLNFLTQFK